jgi:hypothetical protein
LVPSRVVNPSAASSPVSERAAPSTPDAFATLTMPPSTISGSVVVVGGNVVVVVVDVDVLVEVLVEPVVVVMATDVVAAGARLLLQATGSSTSTPTSAQRHTMCR